MILPQPLDVALFGIGNVGRGLIRRTLNDHNLRFVVLADTSGAIAKRQGFSTRDLGEIIDLKETGRKLLEIADKFEFLGSFEEASHACKYDVLIDTSNADTYPLLFDALNEAHVLVSNKKPIADAPYSAYKGLVSKAERLKRSLDYGVAVGAGMRIPDLVKALNAGGLDRIEGCLSGTMNHISQRINEGSTFSSSLLEASSAPRHYAEPDPREDLAGNDFARKLVILARSCGKPIEIKDIETEDLLPEEFKSLPLEAFFRNLSYLDEDIARRVKGAKARNRALWYCAIADFCRGEYSIGFSEVPLGDPIAGSRESDNFLKIFPRSWRRPMTVIGPGAGVSETVTGILSGLNEIRENIQDGNARNIRPNGQRVESVWETSSIE